MSPFQPSPFQAAEAELWARALEDLPILQVADAATHVLYWALERSSVEGTDIDPLPAAIARGQALYYIGVSTVRAVRSVMTTVRAGYAPEALPTTRKLAELQGRGRRVRADHSGEYARQWLEGRGRGPQASLVDPPEGMWEVLSKMAHADARGVETFLTKPNLTDEEQINFYALPERDSETANGTLALAGASARDIAEALSLEQGPPLPGLAALDADLRAGFREYLLDAA